jgi:phage tail sheath gpL-like
MATINEPVVNVRLIPAPTGVKLSPRRALLVATLPPTKSALFGAANFKFLQDSQALSFEQKTKKELADLLGTGRAFHTMQQAIAGSAKQYPIDILLLKNEAATDTTTITFGATAANDGTLTLSVFDAFQFTFKVDFKAGDTKASVTAKIINQLASKENAPFYFTSSVGDLTITWLDGFNSKSTPIHIKCLDSGLAPVVENVSNTTPTQPSVSFFDVVGDQRYTTILWPDYYSDSIQNVLLPYLSGRLNVYNNILDGIGYCALTDTAVNMLTFTETFNGEGVVISAHNLIDGLFDASIGAADTQCPDMLMAFSATAIDRTAVSGADLTDIVSGASGLSDYTGGEALASLPYHGIPIANSLPNNPSWYFSLEVQKTLKDFNLSTIGVNRAANTNIVGRFQTQFKTDASGNVNTTWKPLEHIRTSSIVREYFDTALRTEMSKKRMTNGDLIEGRSMTNKALVEVFLSNIYQEIAELALVTSGADALKSFQKFLKVEIDTNNQAINVNCVVEIVTHVGNVTMNLSVTTNYNNVRA